MSVASVAYSESTAIETLGASGGKLGVLQGKDQSKIGHGRRQGEIDLDLGSSGPLSGHGEETDGQHGPETSLPAVEVFGRIELVGQLRVRNFDLDDALGVGRHQGIDSRPLGNVGTWRARSQGRTIG